jgi:hypothetical protein
MDYGKHEACQGVSNACKILHTKVTFYPPCSGGTWNQNFKASKQSDYDYTTAF